MQPLCSLPLKVLKIAQHLPAKDLRAVSAALDQSFSALSKDNPSCPDRVSKLFLKNDAEHQALAK